MWYSACLVRLVVWPPSLSLSAWGPDCRQDQSRLSRTVGYQIATSLIGLWKPSGRAVPDMSREEPAAFLMGECRLVSDTAATTTRVRMQIATMNLAVNDVVWPLQLRPWPYTTRPEPTPLPLHCCT
ncbi:hypothetical protein EDD17DRAFT_236002 [Pisolithus thermaeus]|nr:hypothetical protein EDD17DRAFT_236002 [Pisolithus thermaeus]